MRPEYLVDNQGYRIADPTTASRIGIPGPYGRERVVTAIPLNEAETGPVLIARRETIEDAAGFRIGDPVTGTILGMPPIWVHRMLSARWTQDTRRLP